ncbi:hypothetical protein [Pseudoduganella lurida]|uniref:hypothetical protein n=1 Tax=Pseudoduganella lurida TaxID=1036180 RepID=UPI0011A61386|nr:hypothetical protein [Pseudoduganella lurida]
MILLDGALIAPLPEYDFLASAERAKLHPRKRIPMTNRANYSLPVFLGTEAFGLILAYHDQTLEVVSVAWGSCGSGVKGYDATEDDLMGDLARLSSFFVQYLGREPDEQRFNAITFNYTWGSLQCTASLQAQSVGLGIRWRRHGWRH